VLRISNLESESILTSEDLTSCFQLKQSGIIELRNERYHLSDGEQITFRIDRAAKGFALHFHNPNIDVKLDFEGDSSITLTSNQIRENSQKFGVDIALVHENLNYPLRIIKCGVASPFSVESKISVKNKEIIVNILDWDNEPHHNSLAWPLYLEYQDIMTENSPWTRSGESVGSDAFGTNMMIHSEKLLESYRKGKSFRFRFISNNEAKECSLGVLCINNPIIKLTNSHDKVIPVSKWLTEGDPLQISYNRLNIDTTTNEETWIENSFLPLNMAKHWVDFTPLNLELLSYDSDLTEDSSNIKFTLKLKIRNDLKEDLHGNLLLMFETCNEEKSPKTPPTILDYDHTSKVLQIVIEEPFWDSLVKTTKWNHDIPLYVKTTPFGERFFLGDLHYDDKIISEVKESSTQTFQSSFHPSIFNLETIVLLGRKMPSGMSFCPKDGTFMSITCSKCGYTGPTNKHMNSVSKKVTNDWWCDVTEIKSGWQFGILPNNKLYVPAYNNNFKSEQFTFKKGSFEYLIRRG